MKSKIIRKLPKCKVINERDLVSFDNNPNIVGIVTSINKWNDCKIVILANNDPCPQAHMKPGLCTDRHRDVLSYFEGKLNLTQ